DRTLYMRLRSPALHRPVQRGATTGPAICACLGFASSSDNRGARVPGVVIVGTGFGCITHLRALRAAGFDVVALVGRDPDKTRARADRFEVPYGLTDL